jgi:hypothetical protein
MDKALTYLKNNIGIFIAGALFMLVLALLFTAPKHSDEALQEARRRERLAVDSIQAARIRFEGHEFCIDSMVELTVIGDKGLKQWGKSIDEIKEEIKNEKSENRYSNRRISGLDNAELFNSWASFDTAGYYKLTR